MKEDMKELCIYTIQGQNACEIPLMVAKTFLGLVGILVIIVIIVVLIIYIEARYF